MKHDPQMADLDSAIDWLRAHWDGQRDTPLRLHAPRGAVERTSLRWNVDTETMERIRMTAPEGALGSPSWTPQFASFLAWHPGEIRALDTTMLCGHPLSNGRSADCPECEGAGVKSVRVDRYTYPMTLALRRLARARGNPHPLLVVVALAAHGWRPRVVGQVIGADEVAVLRAIRQLHGRYEAGPVAWIAKSESQQRAEVAA